MSSFTRAGQHKGRIIQAEFAASRFNTAPNAIDICLFIQTPQGEEGWWFGELSDRYGIGHASDKQQWQMTLGQLENIGWKYGTDFSAATLATLVGQDIEFGVVEREKDGALYYDVRYLGPPKFGPKKVLAPADAAARIGALFGAPGQVNLPQTAPSPFPQAPAPQAPKPLNSDDLPF